MLFPQFSLKQNLILATMIAIIVILLGAIQIKLHQKQMREYSLIREMGCDYMSLSKKDFVECVSDLRNH